MDCFTTTIRNLELNLVDIDDRVSTLQVQIGELEDRRTAPQSSDSQRRSAASIIFKLQGKLDSLIANLEMATSQIDHVMKSLDIEPSH